MTGSKLYKNQHKVLRRLYRSVSPTRAQRKRIVKVKGSKGVGNRNRNLNLDRW